MKLLKVILRAISGLYLAALCILWASPYWPTELYWLAIFIQMIPLWLLYFPLGFVLIIALPLKDIYVILISIISACIIFFCIMGYKIPFPDQSRADIKAGAGIRVITCNLGGIEDTRRLNDLILRVKPDIIAMQEVSSGSQDALKYIFTPDKWELSFSGGLGLASRLKIINVETKDRNIIGGWGNMIARYELEGASGRINLFNMHLETPRSGIAAIMYEGLGGVPEIKQAVETMRTESIIVSQWVRSHKRAIIVGDFNMTNTNPIYRKYWSSYTDVYSRAGHGFGYTKYTSWHGVRIDHILCDSDWKAIHSEAGPNIGSDHRPLIADVEFIGTSFDQQPDEVAVENEPDKNAFVSEHFENSLGKFESYVGARLTIDNQMIYDSGNVLKIESNGESNYISCGIRLDIWSIDKYPILRFAYFIPDGKQLDVNVMTTYGDWVFIGGTLTKQLINDGKWHETTINVREIMKRILPNVKHLQEFKFVFPVNAGGVNTFSIDEFRITGKE